VPMTAREFALLAYFLRNPERALTRDTLLGEVWQTDYLTQRTIDNFVGRLRAKFEPDPDRPRYFVTVRGVGYRFEPGGAKAD
jgi:two-component system, OmpR family, alkaline phosphatase synthesis response regulator PhoP